MALTVICILHCLAGIQSRGVTQYNKEVVSIDLFISILEGTLSPSLINLSLLCSLNLLGKFYLMGRIPPNIGQLKAL